MIERLEEKIEIFLIDIGYFKRALLVHCSSRKPIGILVLAHKDCSGNTTRQNP
jgi:hypothetical protein